MTGHPDDALLASWLAGETGERTATWVAEHLDACPACAARAAACDPMAAVWARTWDAVPPEGLGEAALARASTPPPTRRGTALARVGALAALAAIAAGGLEVDAWRELVSVLVGHLAPDPAAASILLVLGGLATAGGVAVARTATLEPRA